MKIGSPNIIFICTSAMAALIYMMLVNFFFFLFFGGAGGGGVCFTIPVFFISGLKNKYHIQQTKNEDAGSLYLSRWSWEVCLIHKTSVNPGVTIGCESFPDAQPCSNSEHSQKKIKWRWDTTDPVTLVMLQNVCNRKELLNAFMSKTQNNRDTDKRKTSVKSVRDSKWIDNKWGRKCHLSEEKQVLERTRVSQNAD